VLQTPLHEVTTCIPITVCKSTLISLTSALQRFWDKQELKVSGLRPGGHNYITGLWLLIFLTKFRTSAAAAVGKWLRLTDHTWDTWVPLLLTSAWVNSCMVPVCEFPSHSGEAICKLLHSVHYIKNILSNLLLKSFTLLFMPSNSKVLEHDIKRHLEFKLNGCK